MIEHACTNYTKARRYSNGLTYLTNTNQKHSIDSQKPKRTEHKHTYKRNSSNQKGKAKIKKKGTKKKQIITWKTRFKKAINTYLSIITLNVSGLNAPMERYRVADWIRKQDLIICCLQMMPLGRKAHVN